IGAYSHEVPEPAVGSVGELFGQPGRGDVGDAHSVPGVQGVPDRVDVGIIVNRPGSKVLRTCLIPVIQDLADSRFVPVHLPKTIRTTKVYISKEGEGPKNLHSIYPRI